LVFALERRGVLVATGSACAANKGTRSHVLTAIGMSDETADGSLRITLGHLTDENTIQTATDIMIEEITRELQRTNRA
jgi:cysteine desulfurase